MKVSLYVKSILIFLIIFIFSNSMTIFIFINQYKSTYNMSTENFIKKQSKDVVILKDHGLSYHEIEQLYKDNSIDLFVSKNINQFPNEIQILLQNKNITNITNNETVISSKGYLYSIFKFENDYFVLKTKGQKKFITFNVAVIITICLSVAIAFLIIYLWSNAFIAPLVNMSIVAQKVAQGDYSKKIYSKKKNDALGLFIEDFNIMVEKLSKTEMLRLDFISNISHEFKTPIQSINGYAKLLKSEAVHEKHIDYLDRIIRESDRLSYLSKNTLILNRLENFDNDNFKKAYYFVDEQIRQSILDLETKWTEKNINFNLKLIDKCILNAHGDMLKQVWLNLFENAIKFTSVNGHIDITMKKQNSLSPLIITVHNEKDIIGDKERVFEKLYKGDKSRTSVGNGLGLSIVKKIITMHDFTISADNAKSGGAVFTITIPNKYIQSN